MRGDGRTPRRSAGGGRPFPRTTLVLTLVLAGACGAERSPDAASAGPTVTDSAGVTIIQNGPLPPGGSGRAAELATSVGMIDGPAEYQLYRVSDAKRLSDGGFAVANGGTRELLLYDPDGSHRATAGGQGQGPSEFGYPEGLVVLPGDTIQVQDRTDRVLFTADGDFVRRITADRQAFAELGQRLGGRTEGGRWMADGSYFAPISERMSGPPVAGAPYRPRMLLVRASPDLASADTLGPYGGILQQFIDVGQEYPRPIVPPFGTSTYWAVGAEDGTILIGDNAVPQIDRYHPDGRRSVIRWSADPEPISPEEVEAWKDRQRSSSWTQGQLPQLERGWAAMDVPDHKAFYSRIMGGSDGSVWIGPVDDPADTTVLQVFSAEGHHAGSIRLPGRFTVHDAGPGWVLGVARDRDGVEYLRLYRW